MKDEEDKEANSTIMIKSEWLDELNKYPYISRKWFMDWHGIGKPGKGIYLIKERAKLVKHRKKPMQHEVNVRMSTGLSKTDEMEIQHILPQKRRHEHKSPPKKVEQEDKENMKQQFNIWCFT